MVADNCEKILNLITFNILRTILNQFYSMNVKKCNFAVLKMKNEMKLTVAPGLPAIALLRGEGLTQICGRPADVHALKLLVVNLMPKKPETECDLLRMLSAAQKSVDVTFALPDGHVSAHTAAEHIAQYYIGIDEAMRHDWDGMIVTGAPLDFVEYEDVRYWTQICRLLDWSREHVRSTMWVCWGAFAALYHRYGINKFPLDRKISGVYSHMLIHPEHDLMCGMNPDIWVPHSRHVAVDVKQVINTPALAVLAYSAEAGAYLIAEHDSRDIMVFGHPEYNAMTLHGEYVRDLGKGMNPHIPDHYYPHDGPAQTPLNCWSKHAAQLYSNWISRLVAPQQA